MEYKILSIIIGFIVSLFVNEKFIQPANQFLIQYRAGEWSLGINFVQLIMIAIGVACGYFVGRYFSNNVKNNQKTALYKNFVKFTFVTFLFILILLINFFEIPKSDRGFLIALALPMYFAFVAVYVGISFVLKSMINLLHKLSQKG